MQTKWRCTVCGYIHEGAEPPENCPICGAETDKFVRVEEQAVGFVREMLQTFQPHPVAAHFPNALVPTLALFAGIALVTGMSSFDTAAFYLLVVVLFAAPVTLATGLREWKGKFSGKKVPIFMKKIALASSLILLAVVAVVIRVRQPALVQEGGMLMFFYLALIAAMLGCVTLLGHYGAKLVLGLINRD